MRATEPKTGTVRTVRGWHIARWAFAAASVLAAIVYLVVELSLLDGRLGFPLDDSWIHLQFAKNLAAGEGLSYNPGEPVAGSTAPLWTAILSVFFWLPGPPQAWTQLLGVALYCAGVLATLELARELGLERAWAALAVALTLGTSWLVWSALSGLEIPLFVALTVWGVVLHLRARRNDETGMSSLALFSVAILARPEGALLLAAAVIDRVLIARRDAEGRLVVGLGSWRVVLRAALVAAIVLLPTLIYVYTISGTVLPSTFAAKSQGVHSLLPNTAYLQTVLGIFFAAQPFMVLAAGAGILALVHDLGSEKDRGLLPALWLLGLPLAYATMSPAGQPVVVGNFGRYYFPLFPVLVVVGTLGMARLTSRLGPRLSIAGASIRLAPILILGVLWPTVQDFAAGAARYGQSVMNVEDSDVAMARWLTPRLPPEAVIAVNDIGALKYRLPNRVVDLAGIAHPEIRRYMDEAYATGEPVVSGVMRFLSEQRPDYLVIFPSWFPAVARDGSPFRPVHRIDIPNNITMGGNELVVYETPWTRHPLRVLPNDGGTS